MDRLAEWGIVTFAMSVLAWVIYRLTGTIVRLHHPRNDDREDP